MLYRSLPRQSANKSRRSDVKYPKHILKTNCVLTLVNPFPLAAVCSAGGLTTTCRIPARSCTPLRARSLALQTRDLESEAAQGWGLRLREFGGGFGVVRNTPGPPVPEESLLGLGGRGSALRSRSPGPVLRHVSCNAGRALSLTRGKREKHNKSVRERTGGPSRPCEACASSPLPSLGLPEPGTGSRYLDTGPASSGGRKRALRAIFGPNRRAPLIQAGGAGLGLSKEREEGRVRPKVVGVSRGQPEGKT